MSQKQPPLLLVALDDFAEKPSETIAIVQRLSQVEGAWGIKVNLDFLIKNSVEVALTMLDGVSQLPFNRHLPIFADLKMWNGKRTMIDVLAMLAGRVDFVNAYLLGSDQLKASMDALSGTKTKMLGVTVLTHYDDAYCKKWFKRSLNEMVYDLTEEAVAIGCHGVILPGTTLDVVKDFSLEKCVPGIRFPWYQDDRHSEEVTVQQAVQGGASIVVCGSPIMKAHKNQTAIAAVGDAVGALRHALLELQAG